MRWATQRTWRATRLCCRDEQQQQATGHSQNLMQTVLCRGVMWRSRTAAWQVQIMWDYDEKIPLVKRKGMNWDMDYGGWLTHHLTSQYKYIMWWIDHHLKPGYIWKEIWNKDAGLSLAYFCTNRQLVFISQYFYMSLFFFLKKAYIILLVYIFIRHGINRKIDKPDYFSLSYWKLQRSLTWPN